MVFFKICSKNIKRIILFDYRQGGDKMKKKRLIAIIVFIIIIIMGFVIYKNVSIENKEDEYQDYVPEEEISEEQMRQTKVVLYFANNETGELETEIKVVDANTLIKNPEKQIMELLIKGPQSSSLKKLIPDGTVLNDIKIEESCAIINVSKEFLNYQNDEEKYNIINSIVNSLTNLKEIDSVKFLINGEENENLSETYIKNKE